MREAMRRCDVREFAEWIAYFNLEPWGEERADLRMGILASLTANVNSGKNSRRYKPEDFIPDFDGTRKRQQSVEEMQAILRPAAEAHNKRIRETE